MEITFIQISKDELIEIINQAVMAAMPKEIREYKQEPFIKGIHELAKF